MMRPIHSLALAALWASGCASWSAAPPPNYVSGHPEATGSMWTPTEVLRPAGPNAAPTPTPSPSPHAVQKPAAPQPSPAPNASPNGAQPAFRPSLEDETLRRPVSPEGPPPASTGVPAQPIDAPTIPDPNALAPAPGSKTLANGPPPYDRTRAGPEGAQHQRTGIERSTTSTPAVAGGWQTIGQSAGGRPIELRRIGEGDRHALVLGSLYGNEPDAVQFVEALADRLAARPAAWGEWTFLLVRTANPDGLIDATQTNSRGVVLNRNFPSANFAARRTDETGLTAASEPESRLILGLLDDFRPDRVIHVRSGNGVRPLVLANSRAAESLKDRLDRANVDGGLFESFKVGSLEEYVTEQTSSELLLTWLPTGATNWRPQIGSIETALIGVAAGGAVQPLQPASVESRTEAAPSRSATEAAAADLFAPYESPVKLTGEVEAAPRGQKGYVQILPPPPEFAEPEQGLDPKYFELPPPE